MAAPHAFADPNWRTSNFLNSFQTERAIAVLNGEKTAEEAANALQEGLATWFAPAQTCAPPTRGP